MEDGFVVFVVCIRVGVVTGARMESSWDLEMDWVIDRQSDRLVRQEKKGIANAPGADGVGGVVDFNFQVDIGGTGDWDR